MRQIVKFNSVLSLKSITLFYWPETAADETSCQSQVGGEITSGGGYSNYYKRPDWQNSHIGAYFNYVSGSHKEPASGYNTSGKGYPDVAVAGSRYMTIVGGTSASAPVVAGMISLFNAARLAIGKPPLGWINPTLYDNNQYLTNNVTYGVNNCTAGTPPAFCCKEGFHNTIGWDPVTGFGSLNFVAFKDFFLSIGDVALHPSPSTSHTQHPTSRLIVLPVPDSVLLTRGNNDVNHKITDCHEACTSPSAFWTSSKVPSPNYDNCTCLNHS